MNTARPSAQIGASQSTPSQTQAGGTGTPSRQTGQQTGQQSGQTSGAPQIQQSGQTPTRFTDWASI